ncbi:uncharacterized protein EMH_0100360 [Eimeria mitis]|uniref:Uncharacterized protein n=1 Tax=Eimeria mitis TaxID=44415 RepID=U6KG10_9EIME|nr:uncharacterized protein EMH_0100360 [Eimeria mitis]CDJ35731.1 hypothetical protein, conserved [Eimeria mitis]
MRSLLLLLCHYTPLQHLKAAATAAAIPVYIHLLQQQNALQWHCTLSTYRTLLLLERAVCSQQQQQQQQPAVTSAASTPGQGQHQYQQQQQQQQSAVWPLSGVAPSFAYWNGYGPNFGGPSLHELYAHLDRAMLTFLNRRALMPVQEGGSTVHPKQQKEQVQHEQQQQQQQQQQRLLEGNGPGPVFSLAPVDCLPQCPFVDRLGLSLDWQQQ